MQSVCVFCGSNFGARDGYAAAAAELGRTLAGRGLTVVYGGAKVGLMGTLADAALVEGGKVIGVIPAALVEREIAHSGLTELRTVESMHQRKKLMADLADGFVALPGGAGTMEELFEVWTWGQLGDHGKPVGLLNVEGFFDALLEFLDRQRDERFMRAEHRAMLIVETSAGALLDRFDSYQPPHVPKWISRYER